MLVPAHDPEIKVDTYLKGFGERFKELLMLA